MPLCNIAGVFAYRNTYTLFFTAINSEVHINSDNIIVADMCVLYCLESCRRVIVTNPIVFNRLILSPPVAIIIFVCGVFVSVIGVNFNTFTIDIININRCVSVRSVVKLNHTVEK